MSDDYYCYPGSGVLRNKLGLTDADALSRFERNMVQLRAAQALAVAEAASRLDLAALQLVHQVLFGDVYAWAGNLRRFEIAKGETRSAPDDALPSYPDSQVFPVHEREAAAASTDSELATALARCWGELNAVHPFREGNGRATQILVQAMARRHGRDIDWSTVSREHEIAASIAGYRLDYSPYCRLLLVAFRPLDRVASQAADDGASELRSFGRRHGRKLSPRQQSLLEGELPRLRLDLTGSPPADPAGELFAEPKDDLWLEIGFGGAEHLVWQAEQHPDIGFIGCEPFEEGVVKALSGIAKGNLRNIRLHPDDARDALRWLPAASVGRAFILFPDPWPKRKHRKRRLVALPLLAQLARVLRPGAELRIATDIGDYARTILIAFSQCPDFIWQSHSPDDWRKRPADWPQTRYERKALAAGRRCIYLRFLRR